MKKSRIAFILPDKIKRPTGGMGIQTKNITRHLEKDFDVDIYAFPEDNGMKNYHSVPNPLPNIWHPGVKTLFGQISYLSEICKNKNKPDIIHALDFTVFLAAVMTAKTLKIPLVVSMQLSAHLMGQLGITYSINKESIDGQAIQNSFKEMELLGLHSADKIVQTSKTYKEIFSKIPGLDQKSVYIPNGIDLKEWKKVEKVTLPGSRKIKVLYVGRFVPQKNTFNLINATIPDNIDLILIGEEANSDVDLFKQIIQKNKAQENFHYYGPAYDQEKINLMSAADAIIIPSVHECHPHIMHEALVSKSVILSSFVSDMSVVLSEDFALHCGVEISTIEASLRELSGLTKKEFERRKQAGFDVAQNYDWSVAAAKLKTVYSEVLGKK